MMRKVVIFHSKTAGGHMRAAEAIASELKYLNRSVEIVLHDALEQTNFGFKINPSKSYSILSGKLLPLFNLLYFLSDNPIGIEVLRRLIKYSWGRQFKKIIENENPDLIVTTHHFISPSTIYKLEKKYPFITVVTDLGKPHRIWFDKRVDKIITPTLEITNLAKKILASSKDQVLQLGYPLKKEFVPYQPKGFTNSLMLIGGGYGLGRIAHQLDLLSKKLPDKRLIVVCGLNNDLYQKISQIQNPNLKVYQFVDNLDQLMSEVDIVITKAGPGTIMEAASLKKPLIITSWVGHQEKENINFVVDNKLGVYCPNLDMLVDCVNSVYQNYSQFVSRKSWHGSKAIALYLQERILKRF